MKRVDSQALGIVNRALGMTGSGAQFTEFLDGQLDQGVDVSQLIRRGRTLAQSEGLFWGLIRNVHTDAETISTVVDPYAPGTAVINPPWPDPVPPSLDIWVYGASMRQRSGGGTFTGGLFLELTAAAQGWGIDDGGAAIFAGTAHPLIFWDALVTQYIEFALHNALGPHRRIGFRMPRFGHALTFNSTSSVTATFDCQILLGLFPVGMGQDAQV